LANTFKTRCGLGDAFYRDYALVALQRYFRLAGQFTLLTQKTGKPVYQSWVPGCLKRVGHFLPAFPEYASVARQLCAQIPLMSLAYESPWF
jgi:aminoglycoside/choline kinase family phosphotransferase